MKRLDDCKLYVITGEAYHPGRELLEVMEAAIRGGADIVQLRDKTSTGAALLAKAKALRALTRRWGALFIVNDDLEVALEAEADGVHLGQDDLAIGEARRLAGSRLLIGISTHNLAQALEAERAGADYIGVGPVYPTPTKPGRAPVTTSYVAEAAARIRIPFFAIGGISPETADDVLAAGARRLCAVSAVTGSADPADVCRALKRRIAEWEARDAGGEPGAEDVRVTVNGRDVATRSGTLRELAESLGLASLRVMAERNGEAVPRADWAQVAIRGGDRIEFVHFVGGG
ncbi:thiamine phosphate synthase [Paenibacillus sp.]|uniref:thiamine phosphate synthase n=1 Tax=Paenibacillus sp. TaxID=58172 RepID=UPI0028125120|nr:thiamine phosphate synthase [Paenibacillus sp.]